jgi:hypothetical protein
MLSVDCKTSISMAKKWYCTFILFDNFPESFIFCFSFSCHEVHHRFVFPGHFVCMLSVAISYFEYWARH